MDTPAKSLGTTSRREFLRGAGAALGIVGLAGLPALAGCRQAAPSGGVKRITVTVFTPPSFTSLFPPIIKQKKLDQANGLDIEFVSKDSRAAYTDYASGTDTLNAAMGLLNEASYYIKGVPTRSLFLLFNLWGTVITENPAIQTLKDLEGRTLAADTVSTNYKMFQWFAVKAGVDLNKIDVQSNTTAALPTVALSGRADAVQLWEPSFTKLALEHPGRFRQLSYVERWKEYTGYDVNPYICVSAHKSWIDANADAIPPLYTTYKQAAAWMVANPDEAATILQEATEIPAAVIKELITSGRISLNVAPAEQFEAEFCAVYQAGVETGFLEKVPDMGIIYKGLKA